MLHLTGPFGESSSEREKGKYRDRYIDYFFEAPHFTNELLDNATFLIIGRRGSGKTALTEYLQFDTRSGPPSVVTLDADACTACYDLLKRLMHRIPFSYDAVEMRHLRRLWEWLFWSFIFASMPHISVRPDGLPEPAVLTTSHPDVTPCNVRDVLQGLRLAAAGTTTDIHDLVDHILDHDQSKSARRSAVDYFHQKRTFLIVDSLERYSSSDDELAITGALLEAAAHFSESYVADGLHTKVFLAAEIAPVVRAHFLSNPAKILSDELFLHWRPKDLIRLIGHRIALYCEAHEMDLDTAINWNDYSDVRQKVWNPAVGGSAVNSRGRGEDSVAYILRHTQLRPRQLMILMNSLGKRHLLAPDRENFAHTELWRGIRQAEGMLADDVLSAYEAILPQVSHIVNVTLGGLPAVFEGRVLDASAKRAQALWPHDGGEMYSLDAFRGLVARLGVVGRVRHTDRPNRIVQADFEYFMRGSLDLVDSDHCAIHPMFYDRLQTLNPEGWIVIPFPDHPDYQVET